MHFLKGQPLYISTAFYLLRVQKPGPAGASARPNTASLHPQLSPPQALMEGKSLGHRHGLPFPWQAASWEWQL